MPNPRVICLLLALLGCSPERTVLSSHLDENSAAGGANTGDCLELSCAGACPTGFIHQLTVRSGCAVCECAPPSECLADIDCSEGEVCYPGEQCQAGCMSPECCAGNQCSAPGCGRLNAVPCSVSGCPDERTCENDCSVAVAVACECDGQAWSCIKNGGAQGTTDACTSTCRVP